jgi:hypothetical protein
MNQSSPKARAKRVAGNLLCAAAILIALVNNDTYRWAIGVPIVLAVVGVGLRIEAAMHLSRSE